MFDPARDADWIGGVKAVETISGESATAVGARVRRAGGFLGRRFSWTTEVAEHAFARRLVLRHVEGPFKGEVVYAIEPADGGAEVSIRNRGEAGFSFPGMGLLMKASVGRDLARLAALVEGEA